jgi:DNA-binding protein H-NS
MTTSIDKKQARLQQKIAEMQAELATLEQEKINRMLTKDTPWIKDILEMIHQGLSLQDKVSKTAFAKIVVQEFGGRSTSTRKNNGSRIVAVKYQDPISSENTWSGRGIAPLWLQRYEAAGRKREEFLIK